MNEEKDLAYVDDLTEAQFGEILADLLAKAQAHMAEAEKLLSYLKEYGREDPERARAAFKKVEDLGRAVQEHAEYGCKLRDYWASKHPGQTL